MKIIIDIGHPAHVHYFRNLYKLLKVKGHEILITSRDKDVAIDLLNSYNIPFVNRGKGGKTLTGKLLYMLKTDMRLLFLALKFKPDLMIGFSPIYLSHVAFLLRIPCLALTDTEHATEQHKLFAPFSKYVITPECFMGTFKQKHVTFNSYMELAYLHPKYFKPDKSVLEMLEIKEGDKFAIIRFVNWQASHDIGHLGISSENKIKLVNRLLKYGKVIISSEGDLPEELDQYRFKLDPSMMHHAIYFASIFYGEGATMASESAVLGTPAVFHNNNKLGFLLEQQRIYGHVFSYGESEEDQLTGIKKAEEIMKNENIKAQAQKAAERIILEKESTTDFLFYFVQDKFDESLLDRSKSRSLPEHGRVFKG